MNSYIPRLENDRKVLFFVIKPTSDVRFSIAFSKRFNFMISMGHFLSSGRSLLEKVKEAGGWRQYVKSDKLFFADSGAQQIMFYKLSDSEFVRYMESVYEMYKIFKPDYAASLDYPIDTHLCKVDLYKGPLAGKRLSDDEIERRINLSLKSALRLLQEADKSDYIPVPVVQGDPERPETYEYMIEALYDQSDYLGLGSLCMSSPKQVIRCIKHLEPLLRNKDVHIFGIGSLRLIHKLFEDFPFVRSVDTASYRYAADRRKLLCNGGIHGHRHAREVFGDWVSEPVVGARILAFYYAYEFEVRLGLRETNPLVEYMNNNSNNLRHRGRPRCSPLIVTKIFKLRREGLSMREIARKLGVSHTTVWRALNYELF